MLRPLRAPRSPYSDQMVARAKALLLLCTVKGVARITGVPPVVVAEWRHGKRRRSVHADMEFLQALKRMVLEE